MHLKAQNLQARACQGQAVGPDSAVGVDHRCALPCSKELPQWFNQPLRLGCVDLKEGVSCDAQLNAIKDFK